MKRQALWMVSMALLVGLAALGQEQGDLSALLLPQETLREVFSDDSWVLASAGPLIELPPGAINGVTALYESPARKLDVVMWDFEQLEQGQGFLAAALEALKPDFKADFSDVLELVNTEGRENLADAAAFMEFKSGKNRIFFVRGTLLISLESDLPVETLVQLVQSYVDFLAQNER